MTVKITKPAINLREKLAELEGQDDNPTYKGLTVEGATTLADLDVTGTITADGLTVDGAVVFDSSAASANIVKIDGAVNQNTRLVFQENGTDKWNIGSDALTDVFNIYDNINSANRLKIANNGNISFFEDTGTYSKFLWDASAERLGIGTSSPAFELDVTGDIAVSGGVYLGGTGSANHLDDYEEGTWTFNQSSGAGGIGGSDVSQTSARYTKIGNQVTLYFDFTLSSSGNWAVDDRFWGSGLPFSPISSEATVSGGSGWSYRGLGGGTNALHQVTVSSSGSFYFYCHHVDGGVARNYSNGTSCSITYTTNS